MELQTLGIEKEEVVRVTFKVTTKEKNILNKLNSVDNMSGYIKNLIREDIEKGERMKTENIVAKLEGWKFSAEVGTFSTDKGKFAIRVDLSAAKDFDEVKDLFFALMAKYQLFGIREGKYCYCQYLGQ